MDSIIGTFRESPDRFAHSCVDDDDNDDNSQRDRGQPNRHEHVESMASVATEVDSKWYIERYS